MKAIYIVLIVFAVVLFLGAGVVLLGRISSRSKKISSAALKKLAKKPDEKAKISPNAGDNSKPDEQSPSELANQEFKYEFSEKPKVEKKAIVTDFADFDQLDKEFLVQPQPEVEKQEEFKRKSFDEILRNREMAKQEFAPQAANTDALEDDDFEDFRQEHSVYSKYVADKNLINQLKNASPQLRAMIISNLFGRVKIDDDK